MAIDGFDSSVHVQNPLLLQQGFIGKEQMFALSGFNGLSGLVLKSPPQRILADHLAHA